MPGRARWRRWPTRSPSPRTPRNRALLDYDEDGDGTVCGDDHGITCVVTIETPCTGTSGAPRCVRVEISQPYRSEPLLPPMPGLGLTLPEELSFTSVAETG